MQKFLAGMALLAFAFALSFGVTAGVGFLWSYIAGVLIAQGVGLPVMGAIQWGGVFGWIQIALPTASSRADDAENLLGTILARVLLMGMYTAMIVWG